MTNCTVRCVPESEVEITAVRAQGAGGQNVNKVASAVHLRFDIRASSLPDDIKQRLLALRDQRVSQDGVLVMKVQTHRSQGRNRNAALQRLNAWVQQVEAPPAERKATRPTHAAVQRRLQDKAQRSARKAMRGSRHGPE